MCPRSVCWASFAHQRQLAAVLGRSTRWMELRMREGMSVVPRRTRCERPRFDLDAVHRWLGTRSETTPLALEERVARLGAPGGYARAGHCGRMALRDGHSARQEVGGEGL